MTRIDVDRVRAPAFSLTEALPVMSGAFHVHRKHQLLFASRGTMQLELDDASWFLPTARAAWISAGVRHRVRVTSAARLSTVYVSPPFAALAAPPACAVFNTNPLARELLIAAERWGPSRGPRDRRANRFFRVLIDFAAEWLSEPQPFALPRPTTPALERAIDYAQLDLARADVHGAARAAGMSPRTLARRFREELGTSWRHFLYTARMLRAMQRLTDRRRVTDVATDLGFDSLSAFSTAFRRFTGQSPRSFIHQRPLDP